jgi:radical SAM superfamily enzyme YgiQ (UPF0313 family)
LRVLLVSTYEMGRQPFGLASPAARLAGAGHAVECSDASLDALSGESVAQADLVAFHLPMHTATRLAGRLIPRVRAANPAAKLCCYGLYAPLNADWLRSLGVAHILGGEFEEDLVAIADGRPAGPAGRVRFAVPDRSLLPSPGRYASLELGGRIVAAGYTEASRGCKHLCRHCPVVPVYQGRFRAVPAEIVLADIRQQVERGAAHITFGDPDFLNGPTHALRIAEALHREFPHATFDATIKVEHLLRHRDLLAPLARTGCILVTTAAESLDDRVLARLDKGHTRADFVEAVRLTRAAALALAPTFIAFTPWTTLAGYRDLLATLADLDLVANTASIQLALRLLITANSRLLELDEIRAAAGPFDPESLAHPWRHSDPEIDALAALALRVAGDGLPRPESFARLWRLAHGGADPGFALPSRATVPFLTEPWFC